MHERSSDPNAIPLIFSHGWPGSFIEAFKMIRKLTDPGEHSSSCLLFCASSCERSSIEAAAVSLHRALGLASQVQSLVLMCKSTNASAGENGGKKQAFHVIVPSLPGTQPLLEFQTCILYIHQGSVALPSHMRQQFTCNVMLSSTVRLACLC